jgi:hypothetical protein
VECAEIRSGFVSGRVPEGAAVDEHLKWCPHCRELFEKGAQLGRRLAAAVLPAVEPGDLFAKIDADLAHDVGLRARLRALPTPVRAAALAVVGLMLPALQLAMHPRSDFGEYSHAVFWAIAALLLAVLAYGALRLARGPSAPLQIAHRDRLFAFLLMGLPALVALMVPMGSPPSAAHEASSEWGHPGLCFTYGALLVTPFLALVWLFERRDRVPLVVVVSGGALAGIAANLLLHAHCPSSHLGHLLLGHASIGAAWALGLSLISRQFARTA